MHPQFLISSLMAFALFFPALLLAHLLRMAHPVDMAPFVRLWLIVALSFAGTYAFRSGPGNG